MDSEKFSETAEELRANIVAESDGISQFSVIESFALTAEALRRTTGKVYYDVQLLAGLALSTGSIAEMQTGEGKTITCGLPAVLYGMTGKGVHVATTNAYLAERDHEELVPIFEMLGLTSSLIHNEMDIMAKKRAYEHDVTYGTGYEFGFDFLRDQLAMRSTPRLPLGTRYLSKLRGMRTHQATLMQRELAFAIIDEADSVLIDEATTPLILSGSGGAVTPDPDVYSHAMKVSDQLEADEHYEYDVVKKSIKLTDDGWKLIHSQLPRRIQDRLERPWAQYVEQSVRARIVLIQDEDYVVKDDQVMIVDPHTGRIHDERKWRSGLHQAVEMRAGVPLTEEREIEARITRQRYFQFYDRVAGMTGTAEGNEAEMLEFYQLPIVKIPRNKPSKRKRLPSRYFVDAESKYKAIVQDIIERTKTGQPILVGTKTIIQSREIVELLEEANVEHTVLNGTQDETEADIISTAGQVNSITIATNMAGRGTDIKLDDAARKAGGLHVIVAEHHDSTRVDRQLIGRSARQSDPGSCQFYVAATDDIIQRFDEGLAKTMRRRSHDSGECQVSFTKEIADLQNKIEQISFNARRKMMKQDNWLESAQKSFAKLA